ncbi:MAG: hypothetical protein IPK99_03905 [Flavobacteriales bacterium]|nr:hypothetical protein [Flavobacteriales bacterium]
MTQLQGSINADGLVPGDTCFFLTGDYTALLNVLGVQGTQVAPVVFMAAPGQIPVFTGSDAVDVGNWYSVDSTDPGFLNPAVYKLALDSLGLSDIFNLYDDRASQTMAREPNAGWYRSCRMTDTSLKSTDLALTGIDWNGANLVVRYANWGYAIRDTVVYNGDSLEYSGINGYYDGQDWGLYLQNKLEALDSAGEWHVADADGSNPILYYYPFSAGPPPNVRISVRNRHGLQTTQHRPLRVA